MEKQRMYLGKFETKEEADKCAEEKNGFVKKQTYKSGGDFFTFWYVYPKKKLFDDKILGGTNDNKNIGSI